MALFTHLKEYDKKNNEKSKQKNIKSIQNGIIKDLKEKKLPFKDFEQRWADINGLSPISKYFYSKYKVMSLLKDKDALKILGKLEVIIYHFFISLKIDYYDTKINTQYIMPLIIYITKTKFKDLSSFSINSLSYKTKKIIFNIIDASIRSNNINERKKNYSKVIDNFIKALKDKKTFYLTIKEENIKSFIDETFEYKEIDEKKLIEITKNHPVDFLSRELKVKSDISSISETKEKETNSSSSESNEIEIENEKENKNKINNKEIKVNKENNKEIKVNKENNKEIKESGNTNKEIKVNKNNNKEIKVNENTNKEIKVNKENNKEIKESGNKEIKENENANKENKENEKNNKEIKESENKEIKVTNKEIKENKNDNENKEIKESGKNDTKAEINLNNNAQELNDSDVPTNSFLEIENLINTQDQESSKDLIDLNNKKYSGIQNDCLVNVKDLITDKSDFFKIWRMFFIKHKSLIDEQIDGNNDIITENKKETEKLIEDRLNKCKEEPKVKKIINLETEERASQVEEDKEEKTINLGNKKEAIKVEEDKSEQIINEKEEKSDIKKVKLMKKAPKTWKGKTVQFSDIEMQTMEKWVEKHGSKKWKAMLEFYKDKNIFHEKRSNISVSEKWKVMQRLKHSEPTV